MFATGKAIVLPALLTAVLASSAAAQAPACNIDEGRPNQIGRAFLDVTRAATAQEAENWAEATKAIQNAVKLLNERGAIGPNEIGRAFVLGKALSLYLNIPDQPIIATKASLGFPDAATETVNLVATVDSLFTIVETAQPECVATLAEWRQQKGWVSLLQGSADHLNAGRLDSAVVEANLALALYESPYAYMVLGHAANNRNDVVEALRNYELTVAAATDSAYRDLRNETLVTIGTLLADAASDTADAATKTELARRSAAAFQRVLSETDTTFARQARRGLSRSSLLMGDTASFRSTYAELLAAPANYTYEDLVLAGVDAARVGLWEDAVKLFDGAVAKNAFNRDALYNGALAHARTGTHQQALELAKKLLLIDPSNPDNWMLTAEIYNGIAKATKNAAQQKALNEQVTTHFSKAQDMPHKVAFTEFSPTPARTTIAGTIENRTDAEKSYTIRIEFLDASGAVLGTQEAQVGPVAGKAQGRFSVSVENVPNVAGFRYTPLS